MVVIDAWITVEQAKYMACVQARGSVVILVNRTRARVVQK